MKIGVDYYPERQGSSIWEKDAEFMARTGVKLIRIGESAWSELEREDGDFNFSLFDNVINIFAKYGIGAVLCVPVDKPPVWLYEKYPEIIQINADGTKRKGLSGNRCINSPVFRNYARRITGQLARNYSVNLAVSAWQIDNEPEAYPCYCEVCKGKFREWLIEKYDNLDGINEALGINISDIKYINPPSDYPDSGQNPSLCLEWYRFTSDSTVDFIKEIMLIIKRQFPKVPVTVNTRFKENTPDFYKLYDSLNFVSYDNYPPLKIPDDREAVYSHAFELDLMRGINGSSFWIMEQLSGSTVENGIISPAPKSGMIMGYSLQAMIHGADTVMHYCWRTALTGENMFRHGILDHNNIPSRRFMEFSELCRRTIQLDILDNTYIISDVAILYSPETDYAFKIQPQTEGFSYMNQLKQFHSAFTHLSANVDVIPPDSDLSRYKLVIAPSLYISQKPVTENLYRYVINGGTLVLTTRSGVKDENNNCIPESLPTVFKELIGAEITEYDPIGGEERVIRDFVGNEFKCSQWCDILKTDTARAYAEYNDGEYMGMPAVTLNRYCNGVAYYVGAVFKSDFYESFISNLMIQTGIPRLKGMPRGVEVTTRTNGKDEYICFFNNSKESIIIPLPKLMYSVINSIGKDRLELRPFEVDIIRK